MQHSRFWLASTSPRRREMISWAGWQVELVSPVNDESIRENEIPIAYVSRLAQEKSSCEITRGLSEDIIIAADTIVLFAGTILGKPENTADAQTMLLKLRGKTHQVITALAVRRTRELRPRMEICSSEVCMRDYSDKEIQTYVDSGDPMDKAGSYAIQDPIFSPAVNFMGCFASVMGLPLCHLERTLRKYPEYLPTDWATICQRNLCYVCPITGRVMAGEEIG